MSDRVPLMRRLDPSPVPVQLGGELLRARYKERTSYPQEREEALERGTLFLDKHFPISLYTLHYNKRVSSLTEWKRPFEICENPLMFADGPSRFDTKQGELANCWFVCGASALSLHPDLFHQVVPEDQSFQQGYVGIFRFRFWHFGEWVEVVIDDLLPTVNGELLYLRPTLQNEFWCPLLEKAYAKLYGCSYTALGKGQPSEALEDFTGGFSEFVQIGPTEPGPHNLFDILLESYTRRSLICCSKIIDLEGVEQKHSYCVTKVVCFQKEDERFELLRLRNPWGGVLEGELQPSEWRDGSPNWERIPKKMRSEMEMEVEKDGEFWISFEEFKQSFVSLEICHLPRRVDLPRGLGPSMLECSCVSGRWIKDITAGGCRDHQGTYCNNPQFVMKVETESSVIIALMQKNRKFMKAMDAIGFDIYKLDEGSERPLGKESLESEDPRWSVVPFRDTREVYLRLDSLSPGQYLVLPSKYCHNESGGFILRVFSPQPVSLREYDDTLGYENLITEVNVSQAMRDNVDSDDWKELFDKFSGDTKLLDLDKLSQLLNYTAEQECLYESVSVCTDDQVKSNTFCGCVWFKNTGRTSKKKDVKEKFIPDNVCQSLLTLMDSDFSGCLDLEEFQILWIHLQIWMRSFKEYDLEKTGKLSWFNLRGALKQAGFSVSNQHLEGLLHLSTGQSLGYPQFLFCAAQLLHQIKNEKKKS